MKAQFAVRWPIVEKQFALSVRTIVPHLTLLKVTFLHNVRCPHMFISRHRHSLSCLLPFMLRAPQVDLSLLVCALEDSWTSSFLYKSPSERDSGDSTSLRLVTRAINTIWDQDLSSHFPGYSLAPFATQTNRWSSHSVETVGLKILRFHSRVHTKFSKTNKVPWKIKVYH